MAKGKELVDLGPPLRGSEVQAIRRLAGGARKLARQQDRSDAAERLKRVCRVETPERGLRLTGSTREHALQVVQCLRDHTPGGSGPHRYSLCGLLRRAVQQLLGPGADVTASAHLRPQQGLDGIDVGFSVIIDH